MLWPMALMVLTVVVESIRRAAALALALLNTR